MLVYGVFGHELGTYDLCCNDHEVLFWSFSLRVVRVLTIACRTYILLFLLWRWWCVHSQGSPTPVAMNPLRHGYPATLKGGLDQLASPGSD